MHEGLYFNDFASWIYCIRSHIWHMVIMIISFLQISLGLHEILGKPIPLGMDNLTWTLLKPMTSDSQDIEDFTEIYSKLNIALDVMHECFEPVKESRTRRDLVEDVIFSRG